MRTSLYGRLGLDGTARASWVTDSFTVAQLTAGSAGAVLSHADPDNLGDIPGRYKSSDARGAGPDRETGDRAACGVVAAG